MESRRIVFYDGECGFCNSIVGFILKHERQNVLYFSSLQSELAHHLIAQENKRAIDFSTFYFYESGRLLTKSNGFFQVLKHLKVPYRWMYLFRFLPVRITDFCYDLVARRRKYLLSDRCYLPSIEERKRFLE